MISLYLMTDGARRCSATRLTRECECGLRMVARVQSEGMRAEGAGDDSGGGGGDGSGDDEYVRLVKAVITRRLGLLLGFAPSEVQPVLLACAYDEDAALHTLLRSLQPADSAGMCSGEPLPYA